MLRWIISRVNIKTVVCQLTAQPIKALRGGSDPRPEISLKSFAWLFMGAIVSFSAYRVVTQLLFCPADSGSE